MARPRHEFDRFVRAAHRRWVAWRVLEQSGIATLWACALALPFIVVLWFRGERALPVVITSLGMGTLFGAIWGAFRRPTLFQTAVEADRQFDLHDLLGTALTLARCAYADDVTRVTIAAVADERCRRLDPSRMVVNRLGARAWAGVGLANALVITLSLMTTAPTTTVARVVEESTRSAQSDPLANPRPPLVRDQTSHSSIPPGAQSAPRDGSRTTGGDTTRGDGSHATAARPNSGITMPGDGTGSAGQTDQPASRAVHASAPGHDALNGTTAGGAGTPAAPNDDGRDRAAVGVTSATRSPAPPWRATTWDADRARALRDVERGAVPDRYRDLIRTYFDHDDRTDRR